MSRLWMVRAGEGGYLAEHFERANVVAIGSSASGDFTDLTTIDQIKARLIATAQEYVPAALGNAAAMIFKFRHEMVPGDYVVTYDRAAREYLLGKVTGPYTYTPGVLPDYNHVRAVSWEGRVSRDALSAEAKNTLGSTLALFEPGNEVLQQMLGALDKRARAVPVPPVGPPADDDLTLLRHDVLEKAHEFIKDRILRLDANDMEELTAALLRAMGYRATVTRRGPDRGRDVLASPDGLGLKQPRISAEVKHRRGQPIGAPDIRSFIGALRPSDSGLYVSTGGFTKEARYEAERAAIPLTLIDLDDLAQLVVEHYLAFDTEGRALLPLVRVYWPAS